MSLHPRTQYAPGDSVRLYTLLQTKGDKLDWSYVDKVVLCPEEVTALYQSLLPRPRATRITKLNLHDLEGCELYTVGFFGNKEMLQSVLVGLNIDINETTRRSMEDGPGIYACKQANRLFAFYWPGEEAELEASTKNIACNFMRYLVELCNVVFICVTGTDVDNYLASVQGPRRPRRQPVLLVADPTSRDDVVITTGFQQAYRESNASGFLLCAGLHSAALLTSKLNPSKMVSTRRDEQKKLLDDVPKLIRTWISTHSVDLSKLEDDQLLLFLRHNSALRPEWNDLWKAFENLKTRQEAERQKHNSADPELELKKKQTGLLDTFTWILEQYLLLKCPWEENLVRNVELPSEVVLQLPGAEEEVFQRLETEIGRHFNMEGNVGFKKLLFSGSRISLFCEDTQEFICKSREGLVIRSYSNLPEVSTEFIVESSKNGPVQYNDKVVLRPVAFFGSHGYGQVCTVRFFPADNSSRGGLVNAGQPLRLQQFQGRLFTIDEDADAHLSQMRLWVESMVDLRVLRLRETAEIANEMLFSVARRGAKIQDPSKFVRNIFEERFITGLVPSSFTSVNNEGIETIQPEVLSIVLERYQLARGALLEGVRGKIEKGIGQLLRGTVELEMKQAKKAFEVACKQEERDFICKHKVTLLDPVSVGSEKPKLLLHRFQISEALCESQQEVSIEFEYHVMKPETLSWSALELRPKKADLERLPSNSGAVVTPQLYAHEKPFLELDKGEELRKVVFLENQRLLAFINFVEEGKQCLKICLYQDLKRQSGTQNCLMVRGKGFDLVCFSESKRFVALYAREEATIRVACFDESFRRLRWTSIEVNIAKGMGKKFLLRPPDLRYMEFLPGRNGLHEIIVADGDRNLWVLELSLDGKTKEAKHVNMPCPIYPHAACVTPDRSCMLVLGRSPLQKNEDKLGSAALKDGQSSEPAGPDLAVHVFLLGDGGVSLLKSVVLDIEVEDLEKLQAHVVMFGTQMQLILQDCVRPGLLWSQVIQVSLAATALVRQGSSLRGDDVEKARVFSVLAYLPMVFEKFAIKNHLMAPKKKNQFIFLHTAVGLSADNLQKAILDVEERVLKLDKKRGKEFSNWTLSYSSCRLDQPFLARVDTEGISTVPMSKWIQDLICLVPIPIARAEHNSLTPCLDGMRTVVSEFGSADVVALATAIRFGLYDDVIESWKGRIWVVSSMGKQSSGKSYLLNHVFGSLFDVAAVRCTDGIWLSCRVENDCMYILLDGEGLESSERTVQEDTLLSLVTAAMSNLTIYNKKDFSFDKEMERTLLRQQDAVPLVQDSGQLFKGEFCVALKDVPENEADAVYYDFLARFQDSVQRSGNNFLHRMYGSGLSIVTVEPFEGPNYFQSIGEFLRPSRELKPTFKDGTSFLTYLKLFIAQVSSKDWGPIDPRRKELRLGVLRRDLKQAVNLGCQVKSMLINLDTEEDIEDEPLEIEFPPSRNAKFSLEDSKIELASLSDEVPYASVLPPLRDAFKSQVEREDMTEDAWFSAFETFLTHIFDRRWRRLVKWLDVNTKEYEGDADVLKLKAEAYAMFVNIRHRLMLCGAKCELCYLKCILTRSHSASHSCQGTHKCVKRCTYCEESDVFRSEVFGCSDVAGHTGNHDCNTKQHECSKTCVFHASSSGCNQKCAKGPGHEGEHKCNSLQHLCPESCSLDSCTNACSSSVEIGIHRHACHESRCLEMCVMSGCNHRCSSNDHFHSDDHLCGNEHPCLKDCEAQGNCEVRTEVTRMRDKRGQKSHPQHESVSIQIGLRKGCAIMIPAYHREHQGNHCHSLNPSVVHLCDVRCGSCGYFCTLVKGHHGEHNTMHGNMRDMKFVSEGRDTDITPSNDSGEAELCSMRCRKLGRGHIHLIPCGEETGGTCAAALYDGARHEQRRYGPDAASPTDGLTHAAYYKHMGFKDPYSDTEQQDFAGCNHYCGSEEHGTEKSYCKLKQWHEHVDMMAEIEGYISNDGHFFSCEHEQIFPNHLIFVIDRSRSMIKQDIRPEYVPWANHHNNRLGCVFEALLLFLANRVTQGAAASDYVSVILFSLKIKLLHARASLNKRFYDRLKNDFLLQHPETGTNFVAAVSSVGRLINKIEANLKKESTTVVFLSDGKSEEGGDPVEAVKKLKTDVPGLSFHTVKFGDGSGDVLKQMAAAGGGDYKSSLSQVELDDNLQEILTSARNQYATFMPSLSFDSHLPV